MFEVYLGVIGLFMSLCGIIFFVCDYEEIREREKERQTLKEFIWREKQ